MSSFDEKILNAVSDIAAATAGATNPFKGKWVSILGDSISTFPGFIPEGLTANDHEGFDTVDKEWWHILLTKLGAKLCVNYSGAGVKITGTDDTLSAAYKHYALTLHREADKEYINLDGTKSTSSTRIDPDVIFVMLGTNDYTDNATFSDFTLADLSTNVKKNNEVADTVYSDVKTAYERILYDLFATYPNATIYCITPPMVRKSSGDYPFPNTAEWSMPLLDELIRTLSIKFAVKQISLLHMNVRGSGAYVGSDKFLLADGIHPTTEGHKLISKACYYTMMNDYVSWNNRNEI